MGNEAIEVGSFVQERGQEVVFAVGFGVRSVLEGPVREGVSVFAVVKRSGVKIPADSIGIAIDEDCSCFWFSRGVKACDRVLSFSSHY